MERIFIFNLFILQDLYKVFIYIVVCRNLHEK